MASPGDHEDGGEGADLCRSQSGEKARDSVASYGGPPEVFVAGGRGFPIWPTAPGAAVPLVADWRSPGRRPGLCVLAIGLAIADFWTRMDSKKRRKRRQRRRLRATDAENEQRARPPLTEAAAAVAAHFPRAGVSELRLLHLSGTSSLRPSKR